MATPSDTPPTPASGSTGSYPLPQTPSLADLLGSSLVSLNRVDPDDAPTVIRPAQPATIGQTLGHFELIEAIGAGGMATVLKARDLQLGRIVALKILPPDTAKNSESVTRFKQEARAAAKLDHDNVARVYFCGEDRGLHFIAFEFVEGENLRQRMDRFGLLSPADAVRFMLQLAAGLQHAADRGVVHRDVKPSNILITPDGKAKLVDMGLARHLDPGSVNGGVTQSGVTLGTFDYISPEQALDPRRADVRSDIYSLGCAFYHALTGRPPVPEGTAAKKLHAHQFESPLDPRDINPKVPDGLAVVLAKMMAKDPARRYQTPVELIGDLAGLARAWELPTDGVLTASGMTRTQPASPRLPVGVLIGLSAAVVAVVVLIGTGGPGGPGVAPWENDKPTAKATTPADTVPAAVTQLPVVPKASAAVADGKALAAALRAGESKILLTPGTMYDLGTEAVIFPGTDLVLEADAEKPTDLPIIRLTATARTPALSVKAKRTTIRSVRFEVRDDGGEEVGDDDPVALSFDDADKVDLDRVRVVRADVGGKVVGVSVKAGASGCSLSVRHAVFDLGPRAIGVWLGGKVTADVRQTAFAPHDASLFLYPDATDTAATVALRECSFLLDRKSAAVQAAMGATGNVTAGYCVFASATPPSPTAGMPGAAMGDDRPVVLRLAADNPSMVPTKFAGRTGEPNAYYRTDAIATTTRGYSFDAAKELTPVPATDAGALQRPTPPWESADPIRLLTGTDAPELAFRLSLKDRKLFTDIGPVYVLGAKELRPDGSRFYPADQAWPPPKPTTVVAKPGQRVVWLEADATDAAHRVYADFSAAFAALEPGDTLLVAANGPVPVRAPQEMPGLRATVQAYPGYTPELVPAPMFRDAALFWLADGELTFDGLAISLTARQFVVRVTGGRGVTFKRCTITLDEKDEPPAVVGLFDLPREMKLTAAEVPPPTVRFEDTLVRGKGRGIAVVAARPFELLAINSAFALDGAFLTIDPSAKDMAMTTADATVKLDRVTTLLTGPVVEIRGPREGGGRIVPLAVQSAQCLFAPVLSRRAQPLVVIDDADPTADPRKYLKWTATRASVFANYTATTTVLEMRPTAGDGLSYDLTRWRTFAQDDGRERSVRFHGRGLKGRLASLKAADLRAESLDPDLIGTEIDAGATLPDGKE